MGVRELWRFLRERDEGSTLQFSAPYRPVNALVEGLYPGAERSIDRDAAMAVPAFKRGRDMICAIGTLPLETVRANNTLVVNPFLSQIDPNVPNVVTITQTVEDLLCDGVAWWRITQFAGNGFPLFARRYAPGKVTINPPPGYQPSMLPSGLSILGVIWMDGHPVPKAEVIRFDSPNAPVLGPAGRRVLARAIALEDAAEMYANSPRPMDYFSPADPTAEPLDDDDVADMLGTWEKARRLRATAYLGGALAYNEVQQPTPADLQLIELQRKASLDVANLLGCDGEDIGVSTTSRTYQNAVDRRKDRVNDTLAAYMRAVTDRLSMGDVTVEGETVRFGLQDYLKADPKTRAEVQQIYAAIGVTDAAEIREQEGLPPREVQLGRVIAAPAPIPATVGAPVRQQITAAGTVRTFARESITFEGDTLTATFAVDTGARTITGLAVPYGQSARSGGKSWRFAVGAIKWASVSRVKLLRDHNNSLAMGRAVSLLEGPAGLVATLKVSAGALGDEALALAADGVLDGLSIGVDFREEDTVPDPDNPGGFLVLSAALREISLTAVPAFDDSRLTSVRASYEGISMKCTKCGFVHADGVVECHPVVVPAADPVVPVTFSAEQFKEWMAANAPRAVVDPAAHAVVTAEPLPYRFDRSGQNFVPTEHIFSRDLLLMQRAGDDGADPARRTDAARRVFSLIEAAFVNTSTGLVSALNPALQRPDMYVEQRDYRYPLTEALSKGAPPNGVQPFIFPKYSANGTLVGPHTEGVEPVAGSFTTTNQTVQPTALSGKASITREVWDMGGNPAVSSLIWGQMLRGWNEGFETAIGTFLNTLTAAADITLNTGATASAPPTSAQLQANWESAIAALQFVRGYDWSLFAMEPFAYQAFVAARDTTGQPMYPILNPMNRNGTATERFRSLNLNGVEGVPAWGLGPGTAGSPNNSWLVDPSTVWAWRTAPDRLEFAGTTAAGAYAPVAMIDIAIWGYNAFANSDIGGLRQVTYDTTT